MSYRLCAILVVFVCCVGHLRADDKSDKKKEQSVRGKIVKVDFKSKLISLKTADGQKALTAGDEFEVVIVSGPKIKTSLKQPVSTIRSDPVVERNGRILAYVLRIGNEVELVLDDKDKTIKEIHSGRPGAPLGKPTGGSSTPPSTKSAPKTDVGK